MIENNNYPWYLQQSDTFVSLYNGFFPVAQTASPLGIGDAFNIDQMTGAMLNWSEIKTWTGGLKELGEQLYSNMIKAKAFATGRVYSLNTLKGVIERALGSEEYTAEIREGFMEITISLTASQALLETFVEARAFDLAFIGKPSGIKVNWEYHYV